VVGVGDVVDEPAREERRERQLGKHHQLDPVAMRVAQQCQQSLDDLGARVVAIDRAQLGCGDRQDACHAGHDTADAARPRTPRTS
jgi:hypothetical protein